MVKKGFYNEYWELIDCGGGIGRFCKQVLLPVFEEVDLVDQNPLFIEEAKQLLGEFPSMKEYYVSGLQDFEFRHKYDCIWIQWVSGQLVDDDYIKFLERCRKALTEKVIMKFFGWQR